MIHLLTNENIKEIDKLCAEKYNIPTLLLMEKAGKAIYDHIVQKDWTGKKFAVVCGGGNNGGDGLVVARYLHLNGYDVCVYITEEIKSNLAKFNYEYAKNLNVKFLDNPHPHEWAYELGQYDVIIDAIFGVGFKDKGNTIYPISGIERLSNFKDKYIYSIDIPSGVNGNSGKCGNYCVYANETLTLCANKIGLYVNPGKEKCGKITCLNIGVPEELLNQYDSNINAFTKDDFIKPKRYENSHKGTYGHVGIIGGRANMTGAASMCALSAYKSGCGYVSIASPTRYMQAFSNKVMEAVICPINGGEYFYKENSIEELISFTQGKNITVLGPGLGKEELSEKICVEILKSTRNPLLIDADGLWAIRNNLDKLPKDTILTPHPKEMSYLTGLSIEEIQNNRLEVAKEFAEKYNIILVLKGNDTITTDGEKVYINTSGCNGMAVAGSGDVLSGIIAGLVVQMDVSLENVANAVYLHGLAGQLAQEKYGIGMKATDIIEMVKI